MMKAEILNIMDEYLLSNLLFCRGGVKMAILTREPNYRELTMTSERWQDHNTNFTEILRSISKIC